MTQPILLACRPVRLPNNKLVAAAEASVKINPLNRPRTELMASLMKGVAPTREHIALMVTSYWGLGGVKLTVGFLGNPEAALKKRILSHNNAWNKEANIQFVLSDTDPQLRIARLDDKRNGGYWSYTGTEILQIHKNKPTMNLEGFTMKMAESEFHRVVRHEAGHTLGFPHEHMRKELVAKIDRKKAIAFYFRDQGWTPREVEDQVLTPIEKSAIRGTTPDPKSIMCYQIPAEITKDGVAIPGGLDIDVSDYKFAGQIYPKPSHAAAKKMKAAAAGH